MVEGLGPSWRYLKVFKMSEWFSTEVGEHDRKGIYKIRPLRTTSKKLRTQFEDAVWTLIYPWPGWGDFCQGRCILQAERRSAQIRPRSQSRKRAPFQSSREVKVHVHKCLIIVEAAFICIIIITVIPRNPLTHKTLSKAAVCIWKIWISYAYSSAGEDEKENVGSFFFRIQRWEREKNQNRHSRWINLF